MEEKDLTTQAATTEQRSEEKNQLEEMRVQYESTNNQLLRITADFANFRRRTELDRVTWVRTGREHVARALLPLVDDIERAVAAARLAAAADDASVATKSVVDGLELLEKNAHKVLSDLKIVVVPSEGMFDPQSHEALAQIPNSGKEAGMIVEVLNKGYKLEDTVLRHAQVTVAA